MICQDCDLLCQPENPVAWMEHDVYPVVCPGCGNTWWASRISETVESPYAGIEADIPGLPDGTDVVIESKDHPLHGQRGTIVGRQHAHYRVKIQEGAILVPEQWVKQQ